MEELHGYGDEDDDALVVETAAANTVPMTATTEVTAVAIPICSICQLLPRQYKCPRCDVGTCSLTCCKRHKELTQCTGRRDRTAFVGITTFTEKHLRSDYHFLEDVLQTKDSATRTLYRGFGGRAKDLKFAINNPLSTTSTGHEAGESSLSGQQQQQQQEYDSTAPIVIASSSSSSSSSNSSNTSVSTSNTSNLLAKPIQQLNAFPGSAKKLVKAAASRGINLVLMPPGMVKRTINTSCFRPKANLLLWRVHLVFIINNAYHPSTLLRPESKATTFTCGIDASNEGPGQGQQASALNEFQPHLSVTEDSLVSFAISGVEETRCIHDILSDYLDPRPGNSLQRHALRSLRASRGNQQLRCLMQSIPSPANAPLFMEIPMEFTLQSALAGKTIIEYPTLLFGSLDNTTKLKMKIAEVPVSVNTGVSGSGSASSSMPLSASAAMPVPVPATAAPAPAAGTMMSSSLCSENGSIIGGGGGVSVGGVGVVEVGVEGSGLGRVSLTVDDPLLLETMGEPMESPCTRQVVQGLAHSLEQQSLLSLSMHNDVVSSNGSGNSSSGSSCSLLKRKEHGISDNGGGFDGGGTDNSYEDDSSSGNGNSSSSSSSNGHDECELPVKKRVRISSIMPLSDASQRGKPILLRDEMEDGEEVDNDDDNDDGDGDDNGAVNEEDGDAVNEEDGDAVNEEDGDADEDDEDDDGYVVRADGLATMVNASNATTATKGKGSRVAKVINKPSTNINPHEIAESGGVEKVGEDDEDEDEEEDDGDADEEFFNALKEFEGKDIAALQAFIASHPLGD